MYTFQVKILLFYSKLDIKPFKQEFIEKSVLERLIDNDEIYVHKYLVQPASNKSEQIKSQKATYIYKYGEAVDYFVLVVEGCLIVEAGKEQTEFLAKQFDHFGDKALLGMYFFIHNLRCQSFEF